MAMKKLISILIITALYSLPAYSQWQLADNLQLIIYDIFEQLSEDDKQVDYEQLSEELMTLHENPIDINNANAEQLHSIPFLSDEQIDQLLLFVYEQPLHSVYELRLVKGFRDYEIRNLLPFIEVKPSNKKEPFYWKEMWHYANHEVQTRIDAANIENSAGDPIHATVKYKLSYKNKVKAGLTLDRDPREPLYAPQKTYGADFYGGYFQLDDINVLKRLVVGDYKAVFGQGLTINTNLNLTGKSSILYGSYTQEGIRAKSSAAEYNFLRGAGAALQIKDFIITAFYSARKIDGKIADGVFPTIIQTGYHRTENELDSKRTVWQQVAAMNVTYRYKQLQVALTASEMILGDTLRPTANYYNTNYFTGKRQFSAGLNYRYRYRWLSLQGEVATAQNTRWGWAVSNTLQIAPISDFKLFLLHRYFSNSFDNMLASSFSESSRMAGEHGLLLGINTSLIRNCQLIAYADLFKFSFPVYGNKKPSDGYDIRAELKWQTTKHINMLWRLSAKSKNNVDKYVFRYMLTYDINNWQIRGLVEGNIAKHDSLTYGLILQAGAKYQFRQVPIVLQAAAEVFRAKDYNNRFYIYENDVLHSFSIPMLYGTGARYYLNARYKINGNVSLYFKLSQSFYADFQVSPAAVKHQTDIHFFARFKF